MDQELRSENTRKAKEDYEAIKLLFDKQIELAKLKHKGTPIWKILLLIFAGISAVSFLLFVCYMMYKQSFTMETLLTVLLSFFSIILSIMFFIQSEKSSSSYYMKSYEIMKDVSVLLGKIEAGFGEKLTEIKTNIDKMEHKTAQIQTKLEQGEKEEEEIKNKLKTEKSDKEREKLVDDFQEKIQENAKLKRQLERMRQVRTQMMEENSLMREKIMSQEQLLNDYMNDKNLRNYISHYYFKQK